MLFALGVYSGARFSEMDPVTHPFFRLPMLKSICTTQELLLKGYLKNFMNMKIGTQRKSNVYLLLPILQDLAVPLPTIMLQPKKKYERQNSMKNLECKLVNSNLNFKINIQSFCFLGCTNSLL